MEHYFQSKKKLFSNCSKAIVNVDTSEGLVIAAEFKGECLKYGMGPLADVRATDIAGFPGKTEFWIHFKNDKEKVEIPLIGKHNVSNALAATSAALLKGYPLSSIAKGLGQCAQVSGRLQAVPNPLGLSIFVDFAHKEDALKRVMESLRELNFEKVILVFGCGGDRDRSKRPKMGAIAEKRQIG